MRLGIIDLGTNSVRFDIHQIGPGARVKLLHREKIMVRLGQGVFLRGKLDRAAMHRTLQAFQKFKRVAAQLRTSKIVAFGTSALREVSDRDRLLTMIQKRTGIDVRVISGSEEAKLIALGILANEKTPKGTFGLVDIGGGSTEISICRGQQILRSFSFPLGTARLQQVFLKRSPPDPQSIEALRMHVRSTLQAHMHAEKWPEVKTVIGSSGTIRALGKMFRKGEKSHAIERDKLETLVSKMSRMGVSELLMMPRMEPKRVDMILGGAVLFEEILHALGAKKAHPTEFSLRDGILHEEVEMFQQGSTSHLALHIDDLLEKAASLGQDPKHLARVIKLSNKLFDALASLHRLEKSWKVYLTAGVILRNVGQAVGRLGHAAHSAYIVRHGDLPPMDEWEIELVANLCLFHAGTKVQSKGQAFLKLLALLQIVDGLDSGPDASVELKRVQRARGKITLVIGGRGLSGLEMVAVEQRRELFERVFGRSILVAR